jgi:hypothetical protein
LITLCFIGTNRRRIGYAANLDRLRTAEISYGGTRSSNPLSSSGESANSRSQRDQDQPMLAAIGLIETRIRHDVRLRTSHGRPRKCRPILSALDVGQAPPCERRPRSRPAGPLRRAERDQRASPPEGCAAAPDGQSPAMREGSPADRVLLARSRLLARLFGHRRRCRSGPKPAPLASRPRSHGQGAASPGSLGRLGSAAVPRFNSIRNPQKGLASLDRLCLLPETGAGDQTSTTPLEGGRSQTVAFDA